MAQRKGIWIDKTTFVEFSGKSPNSLSAEIATRGRSIDFYTLGNMYLPNPDPVLKKMGKDIRVYKDLLVDAHVGACVINRKAGVKSLNWSIDRGKAKSRQAQMIEDVFKDLDIDRIISEILDAPLYGYQPLETMWKRTGKYWLPADLVGKPQHWFVFGDKNELRLLTKSDMTHGEELRPRKFLLASNDATYDNPYGTALLSRCFWPVTFKKGGYKFWVTFTEKFGMPFLMGKLPRGKEKKEYDELAEILAQMVQDAIAVIPDDGSVEMLTGQNKGGGGGAGSSDLYEKLLKYGDGEVSKAIVGQTLTTQIGDKGSYGASKTHMEVRDEIVTGDKKLVEAVFNRLIKWIDEYNFGTSSALPTFSLWKEEDVDMGQAKRDKALAETGQIRFTKKYFMKTYSFEEEDIEVMDPQPGKGLKAAGDGKTAAEFAETEEQSDIDRMIGRLNDEASTDDLMKPVAKLLAEVTSLEEFRDRLLDLYADMDVTELGSIMQRAFAAAEMLGRFEVNK